MIHKLMVLAIGLACMCCQTASASGKGDGNATLVQLIADAATENKVPTDFAIALVKVESGFRPGVISSGNYGLGQIRCNTARGLGYRGGCRGLLSAKTNLHYSMKYLRMAITAAKGDLCRAATLYNRGLYASVGKGRSTYCRKVMKNMALLQGGSKRKR